jgi:tRNA(adenine34) deaminase
VTSKLTTVERTFFGRAVELALEAERAGNLPIGCVVCRGNEIIAEGANSIWVPEFAPHRHAEMEALKRLSADNRQAGENLALYTTLEPCLMCAGAISLHKIGRVVFGSTDPIGGAVADIGRLPPYFARHRTTAQWIGPALPEACDQLYERAMALIWARDRAVDHLVDDSEAPGA